MMGSGLRRFGTILSGLLGITLVIVVHEFGHYAACKLFKVRTPVFSIGFDPAIISFKPRSTKFQIGAIFLGGYVSINQKDLDKQSYLKKIIIVLAGIIFNILFAFLFLYYLYIKRREIEYPDKLEKEMKKPPGFISFLQKAMPPEAKKVIPKDQKDAFIGPIGIISLMGESLNLGFDVFLYFLAIISLNVAIINLLPIPFFDGGQVVQITIEAVLGRTLHRGLMNLIYLTFFILLLILVIFLSVKDVRRLRGNMRDEEEF